MAVAEQWSVISEPVSDNTYPNKSGVTVTLVCGERKEELGTVGWVRKDSANPRKPLGDVLKARLEEAQKAADELNQLEVERMQKAKDALAPVRQQLQDEFDAAGELLGKFAQLDFVEIEANMETIEQLAKVDFASVEAARAKLEPMRTELATLVGTVTATLDELRQVDLFRLDKARQLVEALQGLEVAKLEERKAAVLPIADRLKAERDAVGQILDDYDKAVDEKISEYRKETKGKLL